MDNETEVEITERECAIAFLSYELDKINRFFYEAVWTEDWKSWELNEQLMFRDVVEELSGIAALHREKFDATVWAGHSAGTVSIEVESVRTRNEGKTPGKKAEPVTPQSLLAKRLKKK